MLLLETQVKLGSIDNFFGHTPRSNIKTSEREKKCFSVKITLYTQKLELRSVIYLKCGQQQVVALARSKPDTYHGPTGGNRIVDRQQVTSSILRVPRNYIKMLNKNLSTLVANLISLKRFIECTKCVKMMKYKLLIYSRERKKLCTTRLKRIYICGLISGRESGSQGLDHRG